MILFILLRVKNLKYVDLQTPGCTI